MYNHFEKNILFFLKIGIDFLKEMCYNSNVVNKACWSRG